LNIGKQNPKKESAFFHHKKIDKQIFRRLARHLLSRVRALECFPKKSERFLKKAIAPFAPPARTVSVSAVPLCETSE